MTADADSASKRSSATEARNSSHLVAAATAVGTSTNSSNAPPRHSPSARSKQATAARPAAAERRPTLPYQPLEPVGVDVVVGDVEQVPGRPGHDPVGPDGPADLEHDHLQGVRRLLQIALGPQVLDQPFGGVTTAVGARARRGACAGGTP